MVLGLKPIGKLATPRFVKVVDVTQVHAWHLGSHAQPLKNMGKRKPSVPMTPAS